MTKRFDAIVVGAGPAGCASAVTLAKKGVRVLCLERGEYAGAKNTSGGVLYGDLLEKLFPGLEEEFPLERRIIKHSVVLAGKESLSSINYQHVGDRTSGSCFSVLRTKFDSWLRQKAEKTGAKVLTEALVDDVIRKDNRVVGVKVRRPHGEVFANLVIFADGVNSLLSKKAGLRKNFQPQQLMLAVKEVIRLPEEVIESRFNLKEKEGAAYLVIGDSTNGIEGGGFLYTNKESLSLGLSCYMNALIRQKVKIHDLLERFKEMEWISEFIKGGVLKEYSGHLIPVAGYKRRPRLVTEGALVTGDAACLTLNNGFALRGMDFALASGIAAAETGLEALNKGDFSHKTLGEYEARLKNSFVLKDLMTFRKAKNVMKNRALYTMYPGLIGSVFAEKFEVTGEYQKKTLHLLWDQLHKYRISPAAFVRDCLTLGRSL